MEDPMLPRKELLGAPAPAMTMLYLLILEAASACAAAAASSPPPSSMSVGIASTSGPTPCSLLLKSKRCCGRWARCSGGDTHSFCAPGMLPVTCPGESNRCASAGDGTAGPAPSMWGCQWADALSPADARSCAWVCWWPLACKPAAGPPIMKWVVVEVEES